MRRNNSHNNNKILLVDDEPNITSLFSVALEDSGFKVDSFNDPLLALDTFKQKNMINDHFLAHALSMIKLR